MKIKKLTILIPFYNESNTLKEIVQKVMEVDLFDGITKEIILIDDGSTDGSAEVAGSIQKSSNQDEVKLIGMEQNMGKGYAIQAGINDATGDFIIIQDADLEYEPDEYNRLLQPVLDADADVVYGSRFVGGEPHRILFFWHSIGNKFLTFLSNMFTNLNLTDMETCYKLFKTELLKSLTLKERRFGFEPEVTAKISKVKGIKIYEVGISYYGRTYKEGKKIKWKDGFRAIYCILKYNIFN